MREVVCLRCERTVEVRPEHLTPTLPPMIPAMPQELWLRGVVGHVCDEADVLAIAIADLAKVGEPDGGEGAEDGG